MYLTVHIDKTSDITFSVATFGGQSWLKASLGDTVVHIGMTDREPVAEAYNLLNRLYRAVVEFAMADTKQLEEAR